MKQMRKKCGAARVKLRSARGESLIELLAAILIGSMTVLMLSAAVVVAARININTQKYDEKYYNSVSQAELQSEQTTEAGFSRSASVTVREGSTTVGSYSVVYYGGNGVFSYKKKP